MKKDLRETVGYDWPDDVFPKQETGRRAQGSTGFTAVARQHGGCDGNLTDSTRANKHTYIYRCRGMAQGEGAVCVSSRNEIR